GDIQASPGLAELLLHLIAVDERIESQLRRAPVYVLRVLVVPHDEAGIESCKALVARDNIGGNLLVSCAEVWPAVDVIYRGSDIEPTQGCLSPGSFRLPYAVKATD